jgi:hypothetical protein
MMLQFRTAAAAALLVVGAVAQNGQTNKEMKGTSPHDEWESSGTTMCGIDEMYMRDSDTCVPCPTETMRGGGLFYQDAENHQIVACKVTSDADTRKRLYIQAWSETCNVEAYTGSYNYMGTTVDGRPYFYQEKAKNYVYFDADCGGHSRGWPMWVIDSDHPNVTRTTDLDGDDGCGVLAKSTYNAGVYPMGGVWSTKCAEAGFANIDVNVIVGGRKWCGENEYWVVSAGGNSCEPCGEGKLLDPATAATANSDGTKHREMACDVDRVRTSVLVNTDLRFTAIDDECSTREISGRWMVQGRTADGRPYFKNYIERVSTEDYIYFDRKCSGKNSDRPMWVLDDEPPSLNRSRVTKFQVYISYTLFLACFFQRIFA